ncbi:hypothetical protein EVAR_61781_1 [Eumeta japonica]|uniref:Uncharacterized protein n=1 Tax=Eumeta variegata TaxID=151549 RepID=A0A4C1Z2K6_EUMVA|nr:hypothetical protein EVAR_61781_1 [Eumeta japonica]
MVIKSEIEFGNTSGAGIRPDVGRATVPLESAAPPTPPAPAARDEHTCARTLLAPNESFRPIEFTPAPPPEFAYTSML